jgi:protein TonB
LSAVAAAPPVITPADRLSLTICLAVIAHAIVILGITFVPEDSMAPRFDTMEIILVQQKSREPVEDAQFLAQAALEGGGETEERVSPATPLPPVFPEPKAEITAPPPVEAPPPQPEVRPVEETAAEKAPAAADPIEVLAVDSAGAEQPQPAKAEEALEIAPAPEESEPAKPVRRPTPTATALLTNSFKIAALSAEIKQKLEAQAQRPKRKFISASTREYRYASYMEAWRAKVERVGNLNYPDEARKRQLSGSLVLDVALNPDGSVNQITIRRSSGYRILDDAAIAIVRLAAPFAPFPDDVRAETDILHITRTWQFLNNRDFR